MKDLLILEQFLCARMTENLNREKHLSGYLVNSIHMAAASVNSMKLQSLQSHNSLPAASELNLLLSSWNLDELETSSVAHWLGWSLRVKLKWVCTNFEAEHDRQSVHNPVGIMVASSSRLVCKCIRNVLWTSSPGVRNWKTYRYI